MPLPTPQYSAEFENLPPEESLKQFYGSITDRDQAWQQLQFEKANNPAMAGLSEEQIGQVINASVGGAQGAGFDRFNSKTRWIDSLGYNLNKAVTTFPGSINGVNDLLSDKPDYFSLGDAGASAGTALGKTFGVTDPKGLERWTEAGRGIPAGLGTLALGALGPIGLGVMTASSYGAAVDSAKASGASGQKAFAVGAVDTAVNLLFLKAGAPLADSMADKALGTIIGDAAKKSLADASGLTLKLGKDAAEGAVGKQVSGRALLDLAAEKGTITGMQKLGAQIAAEAGTEAIQGAVGVGGQLLHEGILDFEGLKENMADPNYWATTAVTQGVMSVVGTSLGRIRKPNHLAQYEQLGQEQGDITSKAQDEVKASIVAKTGEEAVKPINTDPADAVATVASALQATGAISMTHNAAKSAAEVIADSSASTVESLVKTAAAMPKPVLPTLDAGEFSEVSYGKLKLKLPSGVEHEFTHDTMRDGIDPSLEVISPGDHAHLSQVHALVNDGIAAMIDAEEGGTHFPDYFTAKRTLGYQGFLAASGMEAAAKTAGIKMHFTDSGLTKNWLTKFLTPDVSSVKRYQQGDRELVIINSPNNHRSADLHELGHAFDYIADKNGYGEPVRAQWNELKNKYALDDGPQDQIGSRKINKNNMLGAHVASEISGDPNIELIQKYYQSKSEWAAQAMTGYMLGKPSKFKGFVETHFPELHQVFQRTVDALKSQFSTSKKKDPTFGNIQDVWSPGQRDVHNFFEKLFASVDTPNIEKQVDALIQLHNIPPIAAEAFRHVTVGSQSLAARSAAMEAVKAWATSDARIEEDLLGNLEYVNTLNKTTIGLADLMKPTVGGLPNTNRMLQLHEDSVRNQALIAAGTEGTDPGRNEAAKEFIMNLQNIPQRGHRALQAVDVVLSNRIAQVEREALDPSNMTETGKASLYDKGLIMLKVDAVLGRWMRGELEGQKGRFMWDKGNKGEDYYSSRGDALKGEHVSPDDIRRNREIRLSKEFPILMEHLNKINMGSAPKDSWLLDKSSKNNARLKFPTKEAAEAYAKIQNDAADAPGWVYYAKRFTLSDTPGSKSKVKVDWYGVRGRQDLKRNLSSYNDELARPNPDLFAACEANKAEKVEMENIAEEVRRPEKMMNMADWGVKITKKIFQNIRDGKEHAVPALFGDSIRAYYDDIVANPKPFNAIAKELGVGSRHAEDMLLGLVERAKSNTEDPKIFLMYAPQSLRTMWENYTGFMKMHVDAALQKSKQEFYDGLVPKTLNDPDMWATGKLDSLMPKDDRNFMEQVAVLQHADVGGLLRKNAAGIEYAGFSPKDSLHKMMSIIEATHKNTFGGIQNISESKKEFRPLAKILSFEAHNQAAMIERLSAPLWGTVKKVTLPDGTEGYAADRESEVSDSKTYVHLMSTPKLFKVIQEMHRLQNEAGNIKFEDVATNNMAVGYKEPSHVALRSELAKRANDLISKNFDLNNPKHQNELGLIREYFERSYACQREQINIRYDSEKRLHWEATASGFYKSLEFQGHPEQAEAIATELHGVPMGDPDAKLRQLQILTRPMPEGGMGWDTQRALSFYEKWAEAGVAIEEMKATLEASPGYVTEQRLRRWHVGYDEQKLNPDGSHKVDSGIIDFDTEEEAWKFMHESKAAGRKLTVKRPLDSYDKNRGLQTGTSQLETVAQRVVETRKDILSWILQAQVDKGHMSVEEMKRAVNSLSGIAEDISADMVSSRMGDLLNKQRQFKLGREALDMSYQQIEGGTRMAITYARKITDASFARHIGDERLAKYESDKIRFINEKDALRAPDGKAQRIAGKLAFSYFILGNISSAIIEAAQWPLSLSHILIENGASITDAFRIPAKMFAKSGKASLERLKTGGKDASIWGPEHKELLQTIERAGGMGIRPLQDINTDTIRSKIEKAILQASPGAVNEKLRPSYWATAAYKVTNDFYGYFSRINAELSIVSAYEVIKKRDYNGVAPKDELSKQQLFMEAKRMSNIANGSWDRSNRPWWFHTRSPEGRTVAQLAWSLQGYASNYVANHLRLVKDSIGSNESGLSKEQIAQSRKALAVLTSLQVAGLGVMGHTLAGGISKALTTTFGYDPETDLREFLEDKTATDPNDRHAMSDLVSYGMFHALGVPVDFQARMSVAGLGPINAYDGWNGSSFGGPVLSTLGNLVDGWNTVAKGDGSAKSFMRFGSNFLPTGIQRAIRMELFDDGKVFNKPGSFIMEPTTTEKLAGALGFGSRRYSDYMRLKTKMMEANVRDGVDRSRAASEISTMLSDGKQFQALQYLQSEASRLGLSTKDLADKVAEKRMLAQLGPQPVAGAGVNAKKVAGLYSNPLPLASEVTKTNERFKTLSMLNELPMTWKQDLHKAGMMDTAIGLLPPNTTHTEIRNSMRNPLFKQTVLSTMSQSAFLPPVGLAGYTDLIGQ